MPLLFDPLARAMDFICLADQVRPMITDRLTDYDHALPLHLLHPAVVAGAL